MLFFIQIVEKQDVGCGDTGEKALVGINVIPTELLNIISF